MTELSTTLGNLRETLAAALQAIVAYLPDLAAALALLLIGWGVARLLRSASSKLGTGLNALLERFGRGDRHPQLSPAMQTLISNVIFWLVILVFVTVAARVARLELFTTWLYQIVAYLPTLLAGGLILLAGFLVSTLARDVVTAALDTAGSPQSNVFGLLAQAAIFVAAVVIGLDQVGIDITFLTILFGVVTGGLLLAVALAFGLGAREFVGNLLGAHHVRDQLSIGQTARIGDLEGQVVEFTATAVILATDEGRLSVPARRFQDEATLIVAADDDE